jgi:predicted metal-dependent enzyme (double-stranded beta helix superfamily)
VIDPDRKRLLTPEELQDLALSIAARPQLWADRVRHDRDRRIFEQIHLDEYVGVWLLCWMPGHDTGFHDHDISSGAFAVTRGRLREERLRFGAPASGVSLTPGKSVCFGPSDIHRVVHEGESPAVSVHAYSPPLVRMGSYVISNGGALLREPLGPVEELRPLTFTRPQEASQA